ncbi:cyclic GMP-AMP synthase-like receptor 1 [Saccoglossus kowalevskii]|uniref:Cyclic GMP-AMP synthase-like n=1 Tax=Saccoglossus kowalevskii TaxID=10224 RepID=A0ABM0LYI0_SACKO|nr:PREDICTED: cyclic GMP-AMP synthase-like [Saccoglossus kowalevskii]
MSGKQTAPEREAPGHGKIKGSREISGKSSLQLKMVELNIPVLPSTMWIDGASTKQKTRTHQIPRNQSREEARSQRSPDMRPASTSSSPSVLKDSDLQKRKGGTIAALKKNVPSSAFGGQWSHPRSDSPKHGGEGSKFTSSGQRRASETGVKIARKSGRPSSTTRDKPVRTEQGSKPKTTKSTTNPGRQDYNQINSLKQFLNEHVKICRDDTSIAVREMNPVIDLVLKYAKNDSLLSSMKKLPAGSHYEKLKVGKSDEVDVMFVVNVPDLEFTELLRPYMGLVKLNVPKGTWSEFTTKGGHLSPRRMRDYFQTEIVEKAVTEYKRCKHSDKSINVVTSDECPAITLSLTNSRNSKTYSIDLVLAVELDRFSDLDGTQEWTARPWLKKREEMDLKNIIVHAVAKTSIREVGLEPGDDKHWRLSFSSVEKELLLRADTRTYAPTVRKNCYKIFKYILTNLKERHKRIFASLRSFQLKTVFLHCCVMYPNDKQWSDQFLEQRLVDLLQFFIESLRGANLCHFFLPNYNMFSRSHFERVTLNGMANKLEDVLKKIDRQDFKWLSLTR